MEKQNLNQLDKLAIHFMQHIIYIYIHICMYIYIYIYILFKKRFYKITWLALADYF